MKSNIEKTLGTKVQSTAETGIAGLKDTKNTEIVFFEVVTGSSSRLLFGLCRAADQPHPSGPI